MSEQLDSYRAQLRDEIDTENTYRSRIEPVLDFNNMLNKIAPFLEGVEDAHMRATCIASALLLYRNE